MQSDGGERVEGGSFKPIWVGTSHSKPSVVEVERRSYSIIQSIVVGLAAGTGDTVVNYPWTAAKIYAERGVSLPKGIRPYYIGSKAYWFSITPTTIIQFSFFDKLVKERANASPNYLMCVAALSGVAGAFVSGPMEHWITRQQAERSNFLETPKLLSRHFGWRWPFVGLAATAGRDSLYALMMLYTSGYVDKYFKDKLGTDSILPLGTIITGISAATLSQPLDVAARLQQIAPPRKFYSIAQVLQQVMADEGVKGLYRGFTLRCGAVISGIWLMSSISKNMEFAAQERDFDEVAIKPQDRVFQLQNQESKNSATNLSMLNSVKVGVAAGAIEAVVDHPLQTIKTRIQCGYPFTINPRVLYKGLFFNMLNEMGITAWQVGFSRYIDEQLTPVGETQLNLKRKLVAGFFGGGLSSCITNPIELGLTIQQKHQISFVQAISQLIKCRGQYAVLFDGMVASTLRNGIYTSGFYAIYPYLKSNFLPEDEQFDLSVKTIGLGIVAGTISAVISHWLDVVKTHQHKVSDDSAKRSTFKVSLKEVINKEGYPGLFKKGLLMRTARIASATAIIAAVYDAGEMYYAKNRS